MSFDHSDLKKIEQLAYLSSEADTYQQLAEGVQAIMAYVEQLRQVDTTNVEPLFHPFKLDQRLRADEVIHLDNSTELAKIAPLFAEGLYLVPKVIDSGQESDA